MEKQLLHFIAIIPPVDICDEITGVKEDFARRFNSKRALRVVPHITLKAPFKAPVSIGQEIMEWFEKLPVPVSPFPQELAGFGAFHNKRNPVVFVKPVMNTGLKDLQAAILRSFAAEFPSTEIAGNEVNFSPHITIAYRDLDPRFFAEAWKEYRTKKYEAVFDVSEFHLLRHENSRWNTVSTFRLK